MNIDTIKREANLTVDGKKCKVQWDKQLEDDLMWYHGLNAKDEITRAIRYEMAREQNAKAIDAQYSRKLIKRDAKFPSRKKMIQTIVWRENSNARFEGRAETGNPRSWNKCSTKTLRECY